MLAPLTVVYHPIRISCSSCTAQVVPHITDAIQDWIQRVAARPVDGKDGVPNVCVIELGGTVGDIESAPFVEALRQFCIRVGDANICNVHVSLVPVIGRWRARRGAGR